MIVDKLQLEKERDHKKTSFWCSESETNVFDIYHRWIGTKKTNPPGAETEVIFSAGKMMELALVEKLVKQGVVKDMDDQLRIEMVRCGVPITGYADAILTEGDMPCEIKTYYGDYQDRELGNGMVRSSYVKQIAMYMDCTGKENGLLLYMNRGNGKMFEFPVERNGDRFMCGEVRFDITDTYKKWAQLYENNILKNIEPKSEYRYKIPIEEIDWSTISNADISKARNNKKVIGDSWSVQYSDYKDLILLQEGVTAGYSEQELDRIKELTAGYSSKKKIK